MVDGCRDGVRWLDANGWDRRSKRRTNISCVYRLVCYRTETLPVTGTVTPMQHETIFSYIPGNR
jgi:hypothetical protein